MAKRSSSRSGSLVAARRRMVSGVAASSADRRAVVANDDLRGGRQVSAQDQARAVADLVHDRPPAQRAPRGVPQLLEQLDQLLRDLVGDVLLELGGLLGGGVSRSRAALGVAGVERAQHAGEERGELLGAYAGRQDVLRAGQLQAAGDLEPDLRRRRAFRQRRARPPAPAAPARRSSNPRWRRPPGRRARSSCCPAPSTPARRCAPGPSPPSAKPCRATRRRSPPASARRGRARRPTGTRRSRT